MFKLEDFKALNSMKEVQQMSWRDFEWFCKFFLESLGYKRVSVTSAQYDGGVDNIAFKNDQKIFIQAKHWDKNGSRKKNHVPVEIVRALSGSMQQKSVKKGIIIATVPAYPQAKREAKNLNIEIIDLEKLKILLKHVKPNFDDTEYKRKSRQFTKRFWFSQKEIYNLQWALLAMFIGFIWLLINAYI